MVDAISNSNRRSTDDHTSADDVAPVATRYVELDAATIVTPTTFVCIDHLSKTTLFVDGISPSDVRQGGVGDCTLQASLASLARTAAGRKFLADNVRENRDAHGDVSSYTVTVFKKTAGGYDKTDVLVPNCFASRGFAHAVDRNGAVEAWPRVYEQAMLHVNGGPCANMPEAMGILTGKPANDATTNDSALSGKLTRGFALGKVQVLSTTGKIAHDVDEPKLKAAHAYTLVGIEARPTRHADGTYQIEELYILRNPWGYDDPRPLTLDEVKKYFSMYSEGDVP